MRSIFGSLHRYVGLTIAAFLVFSGLTGAIISWDHQIDDWLNPDLVHATSSGSQRSAQELAQLVEQREPRGRVAYFEMTPEAGESLWFYVLPNIDPATGKRFALDYNQVYVDPATGEELGRRMWGAVWPINRQTLMPFLHKLHYTMHLPEFWGSDKWGNRLLGVIAVLWMLDSFVGFYLTLPRRRTSDVSRPEPVERQLRRGFWARWAPSWKIKTSGSKYRINFDVHRAFGLWLWLLIFTSAFTAFSLNLKDEVFAPLMSKVSSYTPDPFEVRPTRHLDDPIANKVSFAEMIEKAKAEGGRRGWKEPLGSMYYSAEKGLFDFRFFEPGDGDGAFGVSPPELFYDGEDGRLLGDKIPWVGTTADVFAQLQFPIHSGRILGIPGRILISLLGLAVATLSITGVVIWNRKRRARAVAKAREDQFVGRSRLLFPAE